jgi:PAS domain-containing protein
MKRPGSAGKAKNQRLSARQRGSSGSGRKITAGKRAEYLRDLEFLSVSATRLLEPIPTNDLFRYIGRRLSLICGRAIVVVNEYDAAAGRIIVRAIAGPESKIRKVSAILGRDPVGLEFTLTEAIKSQLKKGVLTDLEGDLRERALPHLSIPVSERIQQELHLGRSHVMPLILQEKLLGTVAIVTDKSEGLRNSILLEAFINQAVLALNRHRVEDELRTTREWLGQAQSAANAGSWEFDIQSEKIIWTEELARLLNMPAVTPADTEIVRRIIHPDDLQSALDATYRSIETRTPLDIQFRVMTPEGGFRWVAAKGRTFYGDTGRPLRMFGTLFDITEHRKLDEQIRESLAQKDLLLKEVHLVYGGPPPGQKEPQRCHRHSPPSGPGGRRRQGKRGTARDRESNQDHLNHS